MATKQEEIRQLQAIHDTLTHIKKLESTQRAVQERVDKISARKVDENFRSYCAPHYADKERDRARDFPPDWIKFGPAVLFAVYALIYMVYQFIVDNGPNGNTLIWPVFIIWPLFVLIGIGFLAFWLQSAEVFLFLVRFYPITGVFLFWTVPKFTKSALLLYAATMLVYFIIWIVHSLKSRKRIKAAKERDAAHKVQYDREKQAFLDGLPQKRANLKAEQAKHIPPLLQQYDALSREIAEKKSFLQALPGLSVQDKNLHTVEKLLEYFNRGKADSIKEAINLFDAEERENTRIAIEQGRADAARRIAQESAWRMEQDRRNFQEGLLEEQRRHNAKVRERIDEATEKAQRAIDDIRFGR